MKGSLADASVHSAFSTLVGVVTTADVIVQCYVIFLNFRVASATLKEYRYFMLLCSVISAMQEQEDWKHFRLGM